MFLGKNICTKKIKTVCICTLSDNLGTENAVKPVLPQKANTLANYVSKCMFWNMVHFHSKTVNLAIQSNPKSLF